MEGVRGVATCLLIATPTCYTVYAIPASRVNRLEYNCMYHILEH